jgi:transmembrane sensor
VINKYNRLVRRYLDDKASDNEKEVFFHLLGQGKLDNHLRAEMEARARIALGEVKRRPVVIWYLAAACLLGLIGVTALLWRPRKAIAPEMQVVAAIQPGGNHAILTLANGRRVVLDSAAKGAISTQGTAKIIKVSAGSLAYTPQNLPESQPLFNTIATPTGGQYQVTLADGTVVWLNSLSSIRFPTSFNGPDRTVVLTGEAYFEVAKNKEKPFHVLAAGTDIQVLGTSFDVNAYEDEGPLKTTLIEGAVRVVKGDAHLRLEPGEQAKGFTLVKDIDTEETIAWKNGYFSFDDADIAAVMRQLARWYGIQIKYEGSPTKALFWGKMGRDLELTQVLSGLDKSKVHFRLQGNTLTVLP